MRSTRGTLAISSSLTNLLWTSHPGRFQSESTGATQRVRWLAACPRNSPEIRSGFAERKTDFQSVLRRKSELIPGQFPSEFSPTKLPLLIRRKRPRGAAFGVFTGGGWGGEG